MASPGQVATFDPATKQIVWRDRRATPRQIVRSVYGAWAKTARENSLRGVLAFAELVPRDHESQSRWTNARHHVQYHHAAFLHPKLNVMGCIESGKSEQITLVRTAWEIGIDPGLRHVVVGATYDAAEDRVNAIRELIESKDYRQVFPHIQEGETWTRGKFTVQRPGTGDQNPTCQAVGLFTRKLGYRVDRARLDDVIQISNSATETQRNKVDQWLRGTVLSRMTRRGRWTNVQNPWHKDDFGHRLQKQVGVPTIVHPFRKPDGTIRWDRFDDEWERQKRRELGPLLAQALLDCKPYSGQLSRFRDEWLRKALKLGMGQKFTLRGRPESHDLEIVTGVDLAVSKRKKSDTNAMVSLIGDQLGQCNLINIQSDSVQDGYRWTGPEIVHRVEQTARAYPGGRIRVENNGTQEHLVEFAREVVRYVESHTTGRQKTDPTFGLEGIATEMSNGAIAIPCDWVNDEGPLEFRADPEVHKLITEMQDYQPGEHVGDRLMAFWFAWHAIRAGANEVEVVRFSRG